MTTLDKVIEVLSDMSWVDEVRPELTMNDLGLESKDMDILEEKFGVLVFHSTTVNDIVNLIESK